MTKHKYLISTYFFISLTLGIVIGFFSFFNLNTEVEAAPSDTILYGSLWSDKIGWISMNNCVSGDPDAVCTGQAYSVTVDNNTGKMKGAAWSPHIGWIKFGGLSGFLGSGGDAKITFSGSKKGEVSGWARACAGTEEGDCSSMTSRADGWDGWISLSGTNHASPDFTGNGGVTYDEDADPQPKVIGNAWGGTVVGWVYWDVFFGSPIGSGEFVYSLSNTSPNYELKVEQGGTGNLSVISQFVSGVTGEDISLSTNAGVGYTVNVANNNPCYIDAFTPSCASSVTIDVALGTGVGNYQSVIDGVSSGSGVGHTTTVRFEVVPEGSLGDPEVSCATQSATYYLGQVATWEATITSGSLPPSFSDSDFWWRGADIDTCVSQVCDVTYNTVGRKTASVSIDGVSYSDCSTTIIPNGLQFINF